MKAPDLIKHLRRKYGLTQADLAGILCVDQGTISRWQRGIVPVDPLAYRVMLWCWKSFDPITHEHTHNIKPVWLT